MTGKDDDFLPPDLSALGIDPATDPAATEMPLDTPAAEALARNVDALMARPGVVMVGETRDAQGRPAILIGVRTARDIARLPRDIDGLPVVMQVIGDVTAR